MSNRNKLVKMTPEEQQRQDDEKYMQGRPNRMEVANYVNALMEEHYVPAINAQMQLGLMVIQSIIIEKGICTGEELQQRTEEFIRQSQQQRTQTTENKEE